MPEKGVANGFRIFRGQSEACSSRQTQRIAPSPEREEDLGAQSKRKRRGDKSLPVELHHVKRYIQIDKHDDEHEEHHDSADVQNDLYHKEELGLELEEDAGSGEQSGDQENGAVDDIPARHHEDRARYGEYGEKGEEDFVSGHLFTARRLDRGLVLIVIVGQEHGHTEHDERGHNGGYQRMLPSPVLLHDDRAADDDDVDE